MVFRNEEAIAKALAAAPEAEAWERAQPEYIEAEEYVREMGRDGFAYVAKLYDQLERGEMLLPQQVERVQRSIQADNKAAEVALRRAKKDEAQVAKTVDLNRIFIGPEIEEGDYAVMANDALYHVRIERPVEGPLVGFVVVSFLLGPGVEVHGIQMGKQHYQGALAHVVASLVVNPDIARERYLEVA